jgi:hypothetical protein
MVPTTQIQEGDRPMFEKMKRFVLNRELHEPKRYHGESMKEYRARQAASRAAVDNRGRTIHVSKWPYKRTDGEIGFHTSIFRKKKSDSWLAKKAKKR